MDHAITNTCEFHDVHALLKTGIKTIGRIGRRSPLLATNRARPCGEESWRCSSHFDNEPRSGTWQLPVSKGSERCSPLRMFALGSPLTLPSA